MKSEEQKVYIGNGITKSITIDEKYVHYLDMEKLEKIINENSGKKILVGAKEDWFFTASSITLEDIEKIKDGSKNILLTSAWDNFVVKIEDENGDIINEIDCTLNIEKYPAQLAFSAGYDYGINRINIWFKKKLFHECLSVWKYEIIKDFAKEINALVDKYELIHQNVTKYSKHKGEAKC